MKAERKRQWRHVPIGWEVWWYGEWRLIVKPPHLGFRSYRWFTFGEGRGIRGGGPVDPLTHVLCRPTHHWAGERTYIHT